MAQVKITSVRGLQSSSLQLTSVIVEGTAADCARIRVTVKCKGEPQTKEVGALAGKFTATFSVYELSTLKCLCGSEIIVSAACVDDPKRFNQWADKLLCKPDTTVPPVTPCGCVDKSQSLVDCGAPTPLTGPQYTLPYHRALPCDSLEVPLGDPDMPDLRLAGAKVGALGAGLAVDLLFNQAWYFSQFGISDLISTISLAPGERLKVTVKKTQRKLFQQDTLDSVEKLESSESTLIDKDVINVTRSTSETENWKVDGNGGIRLGSFGLSVSAGYSKSINDTAKNSLDRIAESTVKSARSLKSLQKVEIKEQSEETGEQTAARTLSNPYRDRSLTIKVYSLAKSYCVDTRFVSAEPVVLINLNALSFDRDFVMSSGSFLSERLLDPNLQVELPTALEAVADFRETDNEERAIMLAKSALSYLFDYPPNIFGIVDPSPEANNPETSLVATSTAGGKSGLQDAIDNGYPLLFTTLSLYYTVYSDYTAKKGPIAGDDRLPLDLALSLESTLGPVWSATTEKTLENRGNLVDTDDSTECFRRLAGFLSIVSGIIRPLVRYVEKEEETKLTARKANLVIDRTIGHLNCHSDYYTQQFLEYVGATTALRTVKQFVRDVFSRLNGTAPVKVAYEDVFDLEETYLYGNQIIVPIRKGKGHADMIQFSSWLSLGQVSGIVLDVASTTDVVVPFDGIHLEAITGKCVLADVPPDQRNVTLDGEVAISTGW